MRLDSSPLGLNWHLPPANYAKFEWVFEKNKARRSVKTLLFSVMGSVTSALTRTRNALVKVGSEPEKNDPERSQSAPESDRSRKRSARFNVPSPAARRSSRSSQSEVLSRVESEGGKQTNQKNTSDSQVKCKSNICYIYFSPLNANGIKLFSCF